MFPNGNVGLENSKFYEDVPARGHLIGRAATGSCRKRAFVTLRVWRLGHHSIDRRYAQLSAPRNPSAREKKFLCRRCALALRLKHCGKHLAALTVFPFEAFTTR
jgi:hypothetical protein